MTLQPVSKIGIHRLLHSHPKNKQMNEIDIEPNFEFNIWGKKKQSNQIISSIYDCLHKQGKFKARATHRYTQG